MIGSDRYLKTRVTDAKGNIIRSDKILVSHEKTDLPKCFSYANEMDEYLKRNKIEKVTDCKNCSLLISCLEAYGERVYHNYADEDLDDSLNPDRDYDPMYEDPFEDEEE